MAVERAWDRRACCRLDRHDARRSSRDARAVSMGVAMKGTLMRFYVHENRKHHHILLYEWLLEHAKKTGIPGGFAFRVIDACGRHSTLHQDNFFEMAGDMTIQIEFAVNVGASEEVLLLL